MYNFYVDGKECTFAEAYSRWFSWCVDTRRYGDSEIERTWLAFVSHRAHSDVVFDAGVTMEPRRMKATVSAGDLRFFNDGHKVRITQLLSHISIGHLVGWEKAQVNIRDVVKHVGLADALLLLDGCPSLEVSGGTPAELRVLLALELTADVFRELYSDVLYVREECRQHLYTSRYLLKSSPLVLVEHAGGTKTYCLSADIVLNQANSELHKQTTADNEVAYFLSQRVHGLLIKTMYLVTEAVAFEPFIYTNNIEQLGVISSRTVAAREELALSLLEE